MNKEKLRFNLYYFLYKITEPVVVLLAVIFFPITIIWLFVEFYISWRWLQDRKWCEENHYGFPYSKKHWWLGDFEEHRIVRGWQKHMRKAERAKKKRREISIVKDIIKDVDNKRELRRFFKEQKKNNE